MSNKIKEYIEEMRKVEAAATPGPWRHDSGNMEIEKEDDRFVIVDYAWDEALREYESRYNQQPAYNHSQYDNMEFITTVRNDLLKLMDAFELAVKELHNLAHNRKTCHNNIDCCFQCGTIGTAEEALEKIEKILVNK